VVLQILCTSRFVTRLLSRCKCTNNLTTAMQILLTVALLLALSYFFALLTLTGSDKPFKSVRGGRFLPWRRAINLSSVRNRGSKPISDKTCDYLLDSTRSYCTVGFRTVSLILTLLNGTGSNLSPCSDIYCI
jgi:hypothetical protein